jgi:hypothetical protein
MLFRARQRPRGQQGIRVGPPVAAAPTAARAPKDWLHEGGIESGPAPRTQLGTAAATHTSTLDKVVLFCARQRPSGQQGIRVRPPAAATAATAAAAGPPEDRLHVCGVESGPPAIDAAGRAVAGTGALVQAGPAKGGRRR